MTGREEQTLNSLPFPSRLPSGTNTIKRETRSQMFLRTHLVKQVSVVYSVGTLQGKEWKSSNWFINSYSALRKKIRDNFSIKCAGHQLAFRRLKWDCLRLSSLRWLTSYLLDPESSLTSSNTNLLSVVICLKRFVYLQCTQVSRLSLTQFSDAKNDYVGSKFFTDKADPLLRTDSGRKSTFRCPCVNCSQQMNTGD